MPIWKGVMDMSGDSLHFFVNGHTSRGFVTLIDDALQDMKRVYILHGGPAIGVSAFLQGLAGNAAQEGHVVWHLHSPFLANGLDGLIFPEPGVAVLRAAGFRGHSFQAPVAHIRELDLNALMDDRQLTGRQDELASLRTGLEEAFTAAYGAFAEALRVHDDWEQVYIDNMDTAAANRLAEETAVHLLGDARLDGRQGRTWLRFLGAATPAGAVDFVPGLTQGLTRYLLKGRPGSGKSTLLRKVAAEAVQRGFDTEVYRCGFDPDSLDMVIVRELGFAIFDSTAPHEYFPEHDSDRIIDTYEACIRPGTDEDRAADIAPLAARYKANMKAAIEHLARAKSRYEKIVQIHASAVDYIAADLVKSDLLSEITAHLTGVQRET